jgi:hypothetical protein
MPVILATWKAEIMRIAVQKKQEKENSFQAITSPAWLKHNTPFATKGSRNETIFKSQKAKRTLDNLKTFVLRLLLGGITCLSPQNRVKFSRER